MKKVYVLVFVILTLLISVKADMESPHIIEHEVMVTNKEGAICYENGKKTDKVIPYGTMLKVDHDISGSFIDVFNSDYSCNVKFSDVSAKTQSFDINNSEVEKLTPTKAIILAKGGLNMRKGPAVSYSKILTIPQYKTVTITHKAGSFWYYTEYDGKKGWITGMDGYIGYDGKEVLCNYETTKIYSNDGKKVLGTIPANQEITDYVILTGTPYNSNNYYVIYNDIKGYVKEMFNKTDGDGIVKLLKDYDVKDSKGNLKKKITANQELKYNMISQNNIGYFPENKLEVYIDNEYFDYVKKANLLTKTRGYIGEGLYGEDKEENIVTEQEEPAEEPLQTEENKLKSNSEIIIICVLSSIIGALTCLVIVILVNRKKENEMGDFSENK